MGSILIHARSTGRLEDKDQHSGHRGAEPSPRATPPGAARRVFDRSRPHFRNGPTVSREEEARCCCQVFFPLPRLPRCARHTVRALLARCRGENMRHARHVGECVAAYGRPFGRTISSFDNKALLDFFLLCGTSADNGCSQHLPRPRSFAAALTETGMPSALERRGVAQAVRNVKR